MKHIGNISKINVAEAEAVDVVIRRKPVSGFVHCGETCRVGRCAKRAFHGANTDMQGDERA